MLFKYSILDREKKLMSGEIEADSVKTARLSLLQQGYDVLMIESVKQRYIKFDIRAIGFVSVKEKMLFVKHLSLMLKSGMTLDESLDALYDRSRGRMQSIIRRLLELVRKGNVLSDGLKLFPYTFNEFFVNMIKVGEQSGSLEQNLVNLSVKLKKDHDLKSKIKSAMMYPAIVVTAIIGLGGVMSGFVVPKFITLFRSLQIELPPVTELFISIAEFSQKFWYLILLGIVAFTIAVIVMNRLDRTKFTIHWIVLHLPISKRFSHFSNVANFCRSMQLMLSGGVVIDEALDIMSRALTSVLYQRAIAHTRAQVQKGISLSDALRHYEYLFPIIVTKMLHVGEVSGNLSETFDYLAEFYEDELDSLSKNLSTIIEPVLLLAIGLAVSFMALAIIVPLGSIVSGISTH